VGEEEIALLHVPQSDPILSHRERVAAERRGRRRSMGDGQRRITDLRVLVVAWRAT
jgi:hypothetical protein